MWTTCEIRQAAKGITIPDKPLNSTSLQDGLQNFIVKGVPVPPKGSMVAGGILLVLFLLLGFSVATGAQWTVDLNAAVGEGIRSLRTEPLNVLANILNVVGDIAVFTVLAIAILVIIALNKMWDDFIFVTGNVIIAELFFQACKLIFSVPRPEGVSIVDLPASFAFPSAHTASTLLLLGIIAMLLICARRKNEGSKGLLVAAIVVLVLLAILMGLSRVYLGVHWPTDVIGGWLVAAAWLCPTISWFVAQYPDERFRGGPDPYLLKGKHTRHI